MLRWMAVGLVMMLSAPALHAAPKLNALIIGNAAYPRHKLQNPKSDADLVSSALEALHYDSKVVPDGKLVDIRRALAAFSSVAQSSDVAIIFYAGHGVGANGTNWLIPVDASLEKESDLIAEAVDIDEVMRATAGAKLRIVIFDACRTNNFRRGWSTQTRSFGDGLLGLEADNVLILYSAAPGETALDGSGNNSPFTESLTRRMAQSTIPIQFLGGMVRDDVLKATDGEQRPFVSASITGQPLYLTGAAMPLAATSFLGPVQYPAGRACLPGMRGGSRLPIVRASTRPSSARQGTSYWISNIDDPPLPESERFGSTFVSTIDVCMERLGTQISYLVEGPYAARSQEKSAPAPAQFARIFLSRRTSSGETWTEYGAPIAISSTAPHTPFQAAFSIPDDITQNPDISSIRLCIGTGQYCELTPDILKPSSTIIRR